MLARGEKAYCFEGYTLDLRRGCLRMVDQEIALRPKSFEVLRYLVENAGRLVPKDELIKVVWPSVIVSDDSLTRCVSDVRLALGDGEQRIIRTVPRRGYLFVSPVSEPAIAAPSPERMPPPHLAPSQRREPDPVGLGQRPAERRQLTIMACEIVGLAALSTRLDLEDLRAVSAECHRYCGEIIARHHGCVARYQSDGVLAYFGYPDAHEHDAENAVCAALTLIGSAAQLGAGLAAQLLPRIGIASGIVVVGDGRLGAASERMVVGGTPTLAGRLQAVAKAGGLVIAESTRRLVGRMFDYRDLGPLTLEGLAEPAQAWEVLGASALASRFEAQHGMRLTPLVGRDEELELLARRWQRAKGGEGSVVLVSGEPGIGKSRLIVALEERLKADLHPTLRYFCSPHHSDSAFYPLILQLERAAGFERHDTPDAKRHKMAALLDLRSEHQEDASRLAELLSIPASGSDASLNMSPQRKKQKTFEALLRQLEKLSRERPVLMVYEDVHWIDPSSRELLEMVVERVAHLPVLLIITFRPEFTAPWAGQSHVTALILGRLSRREGAALVERVAGNNALGDVITAEIVERTDGVPLFVEEVTKDVLEGGARDEDERTVSTMPHPPLAVPATLHAALTARLDRLGPVAKEIAQIAAAIGREFSYGLLMHAAQKSDAELQGALTRLGDAGLVSCRGTPPQATFLFKHVLVRDVSYATLLRAQRQQLHTRIVSAIEEQFPEVTLAQPDLLALHCTEAGLAEKAVGYRLEAGQQAVARSAMTEAVAQLQKGLDVLARLPENPWRAQQELELQIVLGRALTATRGWGASAVAETIVRARALAEHLNRPDYLVPLLYLQRVFHAVRAEHKLALSLAEQMEKFGEARNDEATVLLGHYLHGFNRFDLGEFVTARALFEQCHGLKDPAHRAFYAALTPEDPHTVSLARLALTWAFLGYIDQARARIDAALSKARRLDHAYTLAFVLSVVCWVEEVAGAPDVEERHAEALVALSNEHGFLFWSSLGLLHQGRSLTVLGQAQEGLTLLEKGFSLLRATGAVMHTPRALIYLAEATAKVGRLQEGLDCLVEAAQVTEATDERWSEAGLYQLRGDLLHAGGDRAAAEQNYHQALAVARRQSAKTFELRAATSLARLWRDQGKRSEARNLLAPIYGWFTEGFDTPDLKYAKALLDSLLSG
jgi:class 3 adenylate cyclase/predicted ATPase